MENYRLFHPVCEWCLQGKRVEVHHEIPLWQDDSVSNAGNPVHYVALCRKCHLYVGHVGDFSRRAVVNIKAVVQMHQIEERR